MKQNRWAVGGGAVGFVLTPVLLSFLFTAHANIAFSVTPTPRFSPSPTPLQNRAPVAVAKMSVDGGKTYSSQITVTQGIAVNVRLTAGEKGSAGSFDPDGWDAVGYGVSKSGKIEWNSDLNLGAPTYEKKFTSPASPSNADMNLGNKVFTVAPGKYTYNLLKITDAAGAVSNIGAVEFTVLPNPKNNRAPLAVAKMSIDNGKTYSSDVTVTQGVRVSVRISAGEKGSAGSYDPDGWDTVGKGVSKGGKIEWNNNLWLGAPKFEKTFTNPASPSHADMNLGDKIFTLKPGKYTYSLLKITDAGGLVSNIGTVTLTVIAPPTPTPPPSPTPSQPPCDNAYDDCSNGDDDCDGYDSCNPYDGSVSPSNSFTAIITSPASGAKIIKGSNVPVAISGKSAPVCGKWTLRLPNGRVVTITAADFVANALPGGMPLCGTRSSNP